MGLTARERISRSIISMMDSCPFYAELMLRSAIVEMTPEERAYMPTMAVNIDGDIKFVPEFVDSLSDEELSFVLLHETQHKVFFHLLRGAGKDAMAWNIAADIVVDNAIMRSSWSGYRAVPPKGRIVADQNGDIELPMFKLKVSDVNGKTTEQIYEEVVAALPPNMRQKGGGGGDGKGDGKDKGEKDPLGRKIDDHDGDASEGMSQSERDEREERAKQEMVEAAFRAQKRGNLPAHIQRMLKVIMEGKVDWRNYLYKYVTSEMPYDYTLTRPNRRFVAQGLYVPGVVKEKLEVVVAIDLSGSVGNAEAEEFLGEVGSLLRAHPNMELTVLCHDSDVTSVTELRSHEPVSKVVLKGGGGTDHRPVFKWVEENKRNARVVVCLTDGYSVFPSEHPRQDVLWVIAGRRDEFVPPFGGSVRMKAESYG